MRLLAILRMTGLLSVALTQVVFARFLGIEAYGAFASLMAAASLLSLVGRLGFDVTLLRWIAKYEETGQRRRSSLAVVFATVVVVSLGSLLGLVLGIFFAIRGYDTVQALSVGVLVVCLGVVRTHEGGLRALGHERIASMLSTLIWPSLSLLLFSGFRSIGYGGLSAALGSCALASFMAAVFSSALLRIEPRLIAASASDRDARSWITGALHLLVVSLGAVILAQSDVLIVAAMDSEVETARYSVAWRLAALLVVPMAALNFAILPEVGRKIACNDTLSLARLVKLGSIGSFSCGVGVFAAVLVFAEPLFSIFGSGFYAGRPVLAVLMFAQLSVCLAGATPVTLSLMGREALVAWSTSAAALVNLLLSVALGLRFGPIGVAIGTLTATLLWNGLLVSHAVRELRVLAEQQR